MGRRLNIWDFDDTLAWSHQAVKRFMDRNPDIENWRWWHDPDLSTEAVMETMPIISMWKRLDKTPGEHWILSGRVRKPIIEWLKIWKEHPELGHIIGKVDKVISTSGAAKKHIDTALKKADEMRRALKIYDEIHVYDDRRMNLDALVEVSSRITGHYVQNGRVVNASEVTFDDSTYQMLTQAQQTIQNLEELSDKRTYREVIRSTISVLKQMQRDMVDKMSTLDTLEYVERQLSKSKVSIETPLPHIAEQLDANHQVEVDFSFEHKLSDFYGHPLQKVYRVAHTLSLNAEVTFDRLHTPIICRTKRIVYGDGRMPTGFVALIWRME